MVYGWVFCVTGGNCFEIDAGLVNVLTQDADGSGLLWICETDTCVPADQSVVRDDVDVVFDPATDTVTATITVSEIGAAGRSITQAAGTLPDVFTATGDSGLAAFQYNVGDSIPGILDYNVPTKQVGLRLAEPDLDPATVAYTTTVTPPGTGNFSASLSTAGLSAGSYEVYARACFGLSNCAYASQDVTLP